MHFWSVEVPVWSSKEIVKITKISFNKVFNVKRQGRKVELIEIVMSIVSEVV